MVTTPVPEFPALDYITHYPTYDSSVTAPPREVVYGGSGYPSSHEKGLHFKLQSAVAFISGPLILFSIFLSASFSFCVGSSLDTIFGAWKNSH